MDDETEVEELVRWFEAAAICHGYAFDTAKSALADAVAVDLNKMFKRAHELGPKAENRLAELMSAGNRPWVRYYAAIATIETHRKRAMETLRELQNGTGLFSPMCTAFLADFERLYDA